MGWMYFKKSFIIKIVIVTCMLLSIINYGRKAKAATVDDLREIIGEQRLTEDTLISEVKAIIYKFRQTQYRNELIRLLKEKGNYEYEDTFYSLMRQKDESLANLEAAFTSNKPVNMIITSLGEVYSVLADLGALKKPNTYILDEFDEGEQAAAYEYAQSILSCIGDNFIIGTVGEGLKPPTYNNFHLNKAYGKYAEVLDKIEYKENDGIELKVYSNETAIVSQFNGVVKDIQKKKKGYSITISHGPALLTTYSYFKKVLVKEGDKVKQYDAIGHAATDTIHFKVILNTIPINPLFLYGGAGERAYSKWAAENPGMAIDTIDFSKTKKYVEKREEPVITQKPSIVYEGGTERELKYEDGYVKPEVPVIDVEEYQ